MTPFNHIFWLVILAIASFLQNVTFSWVSRSRNSGDPAHHFRMAIMSNSVWLACSMLVMKHFWDAMESGEWRWMIAMGVVYTIATACGGTWGMIYSLKHDNETYFLSGAMENLESIIGQ